MLQASGVYLLLMAVTWGASLPCGIFLPSALVGGCIGRPPKPASALAPRRARAWLRSAASIFGCKSCATATSGAAVGAERGSRDRGAEARAGNGSAGRTVGELVQLYVEPRVFPGAYALAGAAGMLGGVQRATISLVVIMIEVRRARSRRPGIAPRQCWPGVASTTAGPRA
jgi:hypothetical protein